MRPEFDYVLVGGGLQNVLIALAVVDRNPSARIAIVERDDRLGGDHTWSMHASDAAPRSWRWAAPLIAARWPDYAVAFPGQSRIVPIGYAALSSNRLHDVATRLTETANVCVFLRRAARELCEHSVLLENGEELTGRVVVDARGPLDRYSDCGHQKFFAQEVEFDRPSGLDRPIVMDATVEQRDGFRFFYVLPYSQTHCLVEDTYFSDSPDLDPTVHRARVREYMGLRGWSVAHVHREEQGVLPMPWKGLRPAAAQQGPLAAGYRGGWMHPATCYSLPVAIRLAQLVADASPNPPFGPLLRRFAEEHARQARFARFLNYLLFRAFPPEQRWHVFARFYRLPADVLARFFALETTRRDRARILCGRPPRGMSLRRCFLTTQ